MQPIAKNVVNILASKWTVLWPFLFRSAEEMWEVAEKILFSAVISYMLKVSRFGTFKG